MQISVLLARREPVLHTLEPDDTVADAVARMARAEVGAVLVTEERRLVGIFTQRDVVHRVVAKGLDPARTTLSDVMTRDPICAEPSDDVRSAVEKMWRVRCRHLPIVADGWACDTFSMRDLLSGELDEREHQIEELQRYIRGDRVSEPEPEPGGA